ncbi:MAG: ABC transporter ATP-binding protein [Candidatus Helarchaeota archaeon]
MRLKNISKTYSLDGVKIQALNNINLEIHQGEVILLLGPSGSGKTTLLSIMGFLLHPTRGTLHFKGKIFNENSSQKDLLFARRKSIGFIFQSFNLIKSLTALQNVEIMAKIYGIRKTFDKSTCVRLLEELNLGNRLNFHPVNLSGGERQRIAIARALISNPQLILADEPTGNLDSKNGRKIGEIFRKIADDRKTTIFCATHDTRLEFCADRVLNIEDGKLLNY